MPSTTRLHTAKTRNMANTNTGNIHSHKRETDKKRKMDNKTHSTTHSTGNPLCSNTTLHELENITRTMTETIQEIEKEIQELQKMLKTIEQELEHVQKILQEIEKLNEKKQNEHEHEHEHSYQQDS